MTSAEKFQLCLSRAKQIVTAYRNQAPEGCDPVNTWVTIGVGVASVAVSAGTAAYQANQQKKAAAQGAKGAAGASGGNPQLDFPAMPKYVPADFKGLDQQAFAQDKLAYKRSDNDFLKRHPITSEAEKLFEASVLEDQKGESRFLPQMQSEAVTAGLGSTLGAFGDASGSGATLAHGGAGEANVAKNLGLSVLAFQDRNRANAQQSLSLAEQIFPRRQLGLTGMDAAGIQLGNLSAQNAWNQADYASRVEQMEFNAQIASGNQATAIQTRNANAQAAAQAGAAQTSMYSGLAQSAIGAIGTGAGAYTSRPAATWGGNYGATGAIGTATYGGTRIPSATAITTRG